MRGWTLLTLAVALPGVIFAATPSTKPAAKPASVTPAKPVTPLPLTPGVRRITLSAEGNAIAQKIMGAPDPRLVQIQAELTSIKQEQAGLMAGPVIDIDKLEPLIRRSEALLTEVRARKNDQMIALLRALGDADRVALLQTLTNPAQLQNSKPAAPAAPASGR